MKNTLLHHLINAQANQNGFSYNIHNGGLNPDKGYMVSVKGYEETAPKDSDIIAFGRDYFLRHATQLSNPHYYMGCWYKYGQFVFDISENIQTKEVAIALGEQQEQTAIWDCVSGSEYRLSELLDASGVEEFGTAEVFEKELDSAIQDLDDLLERNQQETNHTNWLTEGETEYERNL